jgi:WD40 repeat protein
VRNIFFCSVLLAGLCPSLRGHAEPPAAPAAPEAKPVLTLNPGHHVGVIRDVFFTPDSKQVVSVGYDRTVQVWDVESGERLRIQHLPPWGALAAALAPDGVTLLVARPSQPDQGPGKPAVSPAYLLNLVDGRILPLTGEGAIPPRTGVAAAFAADGDRAFVCWPGAFWVWTGLKNPWDRKLDPGAVKARARIPYEPDEKSILIEPGMCPTPDGTRLAVRSADYGFQIWDVTATDKPVQVAARPDREGLVIGLAWSRDGRRLATSHQPRGKGSPNAVRLWSAEGKELGSFPVAERPGDARDILVLRIFFRSNDELLLMGAREGRRSVLSLDLAGGSVRQITRTPEFEYGGVCGALAPDGRLGVLGDGPARSRIVLFPIQENATLRYRAGAPFDLTRVGWGPLGKAVARNLRNATKLDTALDFKELRLVIPGEKFLQAVTRRDDGWEVAEEERALVVRREGTVVARTPPSPLPIRSFALPLRGEVRWVAWASFGGVFLNDAATGKAVHHYKIGEGHAVAFSPDGTYLLTSTNEQVLLVFRPPQPIALLRVFLSGSEWIVWTPAGYYAASPGGERLMGWTVSNGPNALATFHPASQFRKSLYRPDVIGRLLAEGSVEKALEAANQARGVTTRGVANVEEVLPPRVNLSAPGLKSAKVREPRLAVEASARGVGEHPVTSLQLLLDGRPYQGGGGLRRVEGAKVGTEVKEKWMVEVPEGEHTLRVLARTEVSSGLSNDLDVTFDRPGPKPRLYVLAVGINKYKDRNLQLGCAVNDAVELEKTFRARSKELFEVRTRVLTDGEATRAGVLGGLGWVKESMSAQDLAVVFYAGHGEKDAGGFYLLPQDVDVGRLADTGISGEELKRRLADLPGKVLLLLDACHSGAIGRLINDLARELAEDESGVVVMCAALGGEKAGEVDGHGFFCKALIEALGGKAAKNPRDGCVYLYHLEQYVADRVGELSRDEQHPTTAKPAIRPFPLARP